MKIVFTRFPLESSFGGTEVQTLSLMKGLSERGNAVAFLGSCPTLLEEVAGCGLRVAGLKIGPPPVTKWGVLSFLWRKKAMQQKLITAFEQFEHLDAVFMLSLSEKLLATEWLHKKGVKVFWIEHDRIGNWLTKNPWLPKLRELSRLATTIGVSELSKKMYVEMGWNWENVIAIPNGVDIARFSSTPGPSSRGGGELKTGCIARLSPEKGVDLLIEAVGDLPDISLDIVGKGPDEGYLRKLIDDIHRREMQSEKRIRILPTMGDLSAFYGSIDVLVLPSRQHDPFGLVAAEAMMLGIPVIVTDQCGIAGYLHNGKDALIVAADDSTAIRNAIERMKDPGIRRTIGEAATRTAQEKFSVKTMVDAYAKLL